MASKILAVLDGAGLDMPGSAHPDDRVYAAIEQLDSDVGQLKVAVSTILERLTSVRELHERIAAERDRRFAEVSEAQEKALRVKMEADDKALKLAREIQDYKDQRANGLREQIGAERGLYATRAEIAALREYFDALHQPVVTFMAKYEGGFERKTEQRLGWGTAMQALAVVGGFVIAIAAVVALLKH